MSDQDKPLNDGQTVAAILPTIYSSVMDFKRSLTARLWQQGFLEESSKLDDLKLTEVSGVMCLEPQLREMSNNVLKMFQLIDELMDCALQHQERRTEITEASLANRIPSLQLPDPRGGRALLPDDVRLAEARGVSDPGNTSHPLLDQLVNRALDEGATRFCTPAAATARTSPCVVTRSQRRLSTAVDQCQVFASGPVTLQ